MNIIAWFNKTQGILNMTKTPKHKIIQQLFSKFKKNRTKNKFIQTIQTQTQKIVKTIPSASTIHILQQLKHQESISH